MKIPILTYHSNHIDGNDYADNDHVAFASDIAQIDANGIRILPLAEVIDHWLKAPARLQEWPTVALSCDDGGDFDFHDLPHPVAGMQRSMLNILRDFRRTARHPQPGLSITSFVIVSPQARQVLDRTCLIGTGWWNDDWWKEASASSLMDIGNHSWDHNHQTLDEGQFRGIARGTFKSIASDRLADYQVAQASRFLWSTVPNRGAGLFAYPYGESNEFLVREYFPRQAQAIRISAAFVTAPEPLHEQSNRWALPRYMFGRDWASPSELQRILDEAKRGRA
jgi:hypothetical protein